MKPATLQISPEALAKLLKTKMTSAARWKKLAGQALQNSRPSTPSKSPQELPPDPRLSPSIGERLRDIFPAGFESNSSVKRDHLTLSPYHLHDILTRNSGSNGHVEKTIVKSAWYGKQTKSTAKHEFILIQVEDLAIPGLENCIALDRNQSDPVSPRGGVAKVSAVSSGTTAVDTFRISYDGDQDRFLRKCELTPHIELEQIRFPRDKPLLLLNLVGLVLHISDNYPQYKVLDTNCYWFTGLIWECMRGMRPTAEREICVPKKRGKIGFVRCVPNPVQVRGVLREALQNDSLGEAWETISMTAIMAVETEADETVGASEDVEADETVGAGEVIAADQMECLTCDNGNCAGH